MVTLKDRVVNFGIKMEFCCLYHHTKFERTWSVNVQIQVNVVLFFDFLKNFSTDLNEI